MGYPKVMSKKVYNHGIDAIENRMTTKEYYLLKEYKNYALYEDKKGNKECFDKFDCGMVKALAADMRQMVGGIHGRL